jgi:hypothetical protein
MSYKVKYRTFDELLAEVKSDFPLMDREGMIDPQDYIKHAKFINARLGLKIRQTKQRIIEIRNGRGVLPADFETFNYASMIQRHTEILPLESFTQEYVVSVPQHENPNPGTIEVCINDNPNLPATPVQTCNTCSDSCNDCGHDFEHCYCVPTEHVRVNCKGEKTVVLRKYKNHVRVHENIIPLELVNSPQFTDDYCFKKTFKCQHHISIKNNFVFSSIQNGSMYLNYEGMMEDDEGNLLVLDHDLINFYYEYYLKSKVLENAHARNYPVNPNIEQRIEMNLRTHRIAGESIVNTFEFNEIVKAHKAMRKAFYVKYYKMFTSY